VVIGIEKKLEMKICVLDKGFVECQEIMGNATTVVNSARVSFGKQKTELDEQDRRLLRYLYRHKHHSPFRHVMLRFHIRAPEMVMRQWYKHVVGAEWSATNQSHAPFHAWNEISGRYVVMEDIYVPEEWRKQSEDRKQGSSEEVLEEQEGVESAAWYEDTIQHMMETYKFLLDKGVAREQARMVLPMSLYTEAIWTCSFQAVMNFLELRLDTHAQWEIRQYALAIQEMMTSALPDLMNSFQEEEVVVEDYSI
jgi:thymidylate synthase (FAD)